jgi:methylated-DNA-protein-cysteine methyltransferase related protein
LIPSTFPRERPDLSPHAARVTRQRTPVRRSLDPTRRFNDPALEEIWHVISAIPRGKATTYGSVARAAGLPGRARQVGFALRTAPDGLNLPWHRVVGAGGRIVFPASSRSHREQARRLRAEGIRVVKGRVTPSAMTDLDEL